MIRPELSLLKLLIRKELYDKYRTYISIPKEEIELQNLYKHLDNLMIEYNRDISFEEYCAYVQTNTFTKQDTTTTLLDVIKDQDIQPDLAESLLAQFKQRSLANAIALQAIKITEGSGSISDLSKLLEDHTEDEKDLIEDPFVTTDLQELYEQRVKKHGLRWRLKTLNRMLGSLRKGDFGFIFARPETGKTTFLASEISFFASQITDEQGPIFWFNNEEDGQKVQLRIFQATLGNTLFDLLKDIQTSNEAYHKLTNNKIKIIDSATTSKQDVERLCKKYNPSLIVFDQIDKVKGFDGDREDLRLGEIYIWARELAKTYCPVIGVTQADGTAEGKKWLTMDNVANAKCLSPETAVLMYDGSWKATSDIKVGEQVMGPDSTPRNVLNTTTGIEEMFRVSHKIGGDWYDVNKSHLLCLINQYGKKVVKNVLDYNQFDFGYRVGHELDEENHTIEPYYLGLWLGDGKASAPEITTMDQEIKDYVRWYSKCWGCDYVEWQNGVDNSLLVQSKIKYKQGVKHPLMEELRKLNLVNNKHIPEIYFKGSIQQRLELLAGLLDTDGTLNKRKHEYFTFVNKSYQITYGVKCIALSCGLMATFKQRGDYYYVNISGNDLSIIPTKIARKQSKWVSYKNILKSRLTITPIGKGSYAGFVLDGDHQFIIEGNIVTHNTAKQAEADWILGIGCTHQEGFEFIRHLHASKNKLPGDEDTDPSLRHTKIS